MPGAGPPSFWSTPNQGSVPIWKPVSAVATSVATDPAATDAVPMVPVIGVPPLTVTEHQWM